MITTHEFLIFLYLSLPFILLDFLLLYIGVLVLCYHVKLIHTVQDIY